LTTFLVAHRSGARISTGTPDLLSKSPEELVYVDRNPCRFAIFGSIRGHRGILAWP